MNLTSDDSHTYPPYNQRRVHTEYALLICNQRRVHTEYALLIWQPEVSAYSVCTLLWLYCGYVRKLVDYSYVAFIVNPCTPPIAITMACAAGTSIRKLWVDMSSRSQQRRHSCTALELLRALHLCRLAAPSRSTTL